MVSWLNQTQQERIYNSFQREREQAIREQWDRARRRQQIADERLKLHQRVNQINLRDLDLQLAMIEYLLIREHEEALHLPQTLVPVVLIPHFQQISYPQLQTIVNRLAVFPTSAVSMNPPQLAPARAPAPAPVRAPAAPMDPETREARNKALFDTYEAVRNGYITDPESIRELAQRFLEIESDPEASRDFPYDAGRAARTLLQRI